MLFVRIERFICLLQIVNCSLVDKTCLFPKFSYITAAFTGHRVFYFLYGPMEGGHRHLCTQSVNESGTWTNIFCSVSMQICTCLLCLLVIIISGIFAENCLHTKISLFSYKIYNFQTDCVLIRELYPVTRQTNCVSSWSEYYILEIGPY